MPAVRALTLSLAMLTIGARAEAEDLAWSSPEGCPSAAEASASWESIRR